MADYRLVQRVALTHRTLLVNLPLAPYLVMLAIEEGVLWMGNLAFPRLPIKIREVFCPHEHGIGN